MKKLTAFVLVICTILTIAGCNSQSGSMQSSNVDKDRFEAKWSATYLDRFRKCIEKVVFAGDSIGTWADDVVNDISTCQGQDVTVFKPNLAVEDILAANGDLIILSNGVGALLSGKSPYTYGLELSAIIAEIQNSSKAVILLTSVPYMAENAMGEIPISRAIEYNAVIRAVAMSADVLYANLYKAQGMADSTLNQDGKNLSALGDLLVGNEIMQTLLANCSCLDKGSDGPRFYTKLMKRAPSTSWIGKFAAAEDASELMEILESGYTGVDMSLFECLTNKEQELVYAEVLTADRSDISSYLDVDILLNTIAAKCVAQHQQKEMPEGATLTYVAVGDSISYGIGATNEATDGFVPLFAGMLEQACGKNVTLINEAISGTRMSTPHKEGRYPAAKETPKEFVVDNYPDVVTIAYGTNDRSAGTALEDFIADYRSYLTTVIQGCPDAIIIVCGLPYSRTQTTQDCVYRKWNKAIKALAEEFGVIYCDSFEDMYGVSWLLADNVHPTNAGHRAMAHALLRVISYNMDIVAA